MQKLSIISTDILKAIQLVAPVVREKNVQRIFDNLLIEIIGTKLKVTAANPEIRASIIVDEVNASGDFSFCIEKNILVTILNGHPLGTPIELEFGNNEVIISSKIGVYNLPTVPSEDYPKQNEIEDANSFMVDPNFLLDGLKKSSPFVDESMENINGILIRSVENILYIVGCSPQYFYEREFPYNGKPIDLVLSPSAARYIHQSFDGDDPLTINYNNKLFCVSCGNFSVEIIQMDIKFPDYKKIMNAVKKSMCFKIDREVLLTSVKRFHSISDRDNNTLILDIKSNTLELYFENTAKSFKAKETLDCTYDGDELKIGFNVNYLKVVLGILDSDIEWYFHEVKHPTMFIEENTRILLMAQKFKENVKPSE
jgi:DNA polymerase III subunit beta